ncbi:hypothetical protein F5884DRAFT_748189 [Xylogone sp. PMI_703]|nr:hypothetical protein F5884DRAFT_748189 [Xylogone sp. PMI_703]
MKHLLSSCLAFISLAKVVLCTSLKSQGLPLHTTTVYQFDEPTLIENFAIRANGKQLLTLISRPDVYLLDPSSQSVELIYSFPEVNSVLGICEISPDVFITVAGNFTASTVTSQKGSWSVWKLDFNHQQPRISKVVSIPEAEFPNGLETLPGRAAQVLIADSVLGAVWRVDAKTAAYEVLIELPEMKAPPASAVEIGINGLHILNGYLYWTNYSAKIFYRLKIDRYGQPAKGNSAEIVAKPGVFMDDFTFDEAGNAWIATNPDNRVIVVGADHKIITVAGSVSELTVAGCTATHFGKTWKDKHILYVTTNGAMAAPVNGTVTENGKVVAIDTKGFWI